MQVIRALDQVHDAFIAYDNLALSATAITPITEQVGYEAVNLFNYFTYDSYKPVNTGTGAVFIELGSAQACDYFAFYNQDYYLNSGTIDFEYWDGASWVGLIGGPYSPTDNSPQLFIFDEVSSDEFRIVIDSPVISALSCASFGKVLPIPFGLDTSFNSPHNSQQYHDTTNTSETGNFIGRSVYKEAIPYQISTELLQYDWFVDNWRPFTRHAERRPFWFKWSDTSYTDESVFCWTDGRVPTPSQTDAHFMSFTLPLKGLVS